ncbi:hypothetical protein CEXT_427641 [Caerostris extrusa]|uniref:Uncharacterized protein n=1 Tax=Caerostris extrusa TaxID=172846 RepID=A0AAV4MKE2_CAEEX|nr:hypothetical protein CEXT_169751 [Caerostris extrusa]GIX93430.1 hypothetical protein CEXT_427641 [Caerostris extrusa]
MGCKMLENVNLRKISKAFSVQLVHISGILERSSFCCQIGTRRFELTLGVENGEHKITLYFRTALKSRKGSPKEMVVEI